MMKTNSIFLIEDDSSILEAIQMVLEAYDYGATTASNGREALKQLHEMEIKPQLILLDLMMPEMNGFEFLKAKSEDSSIKDIPVLVFSANSHFESKIKHEGNVVEFLKKPVDIDELLDAVGRVVKA